MVYGLHPVKISRDIFSREMKEVKLKIAHYREAYEAQGSGQSPPRNILGRGWWKKWKEKWRSVKQDKSLPQKNIPGAQIKGIYTFWFFPHWEF